MSSKFSSWASRLSEVFSINASSLLKPLAVMMTAAKVQRLNNKDFMLANSERNGLVRKSFEKATLRTECVGCGLKAFI